MAGKLRYPIIGVITSAVLLLAVLALKYSPRGPVQVKKLPDGSVLRLVKVNFGKRDTNYIPMGLLDRVKTKLIQVLPPTWSRTLSKGFVYSSPGSSMSGGPVHTNLDSLHIWITRRNATNGMIAVGVRRGVIIDDRGCEFPESQLGETFGPYIRSAGSMNLANLCNWLTFEAFPRNQRTFHLQLFSDSGERVADFVVENPAPAPKPAHWTTRPLPMTNLQGDTAFTLADVRIKPVFNLADRLAQMILGLGSSTYQAPNVIAPKFRISESGKASE